MATSEQPAGLQASAAALDHLTTQAGTDPSNPQKHLHAPSDTSHAHGLLSKFFPSQETIDAWENRFHMGNYVIDRATGQKSFEAMSVYVRAGMHLLYYGRAQEHVLQNHQVEKLLKEQSLKMGVQYDDPKSVDHIQPFIDGFKLGPSMNEMVQPDPKAYKTFNEFFAREIKESARPVDEPQDDAVTSSPADCRLTTFPSVDAATRFWIKGEGFGLAKLFQDEGMGREFEGGAIAIARLAPQDYHRWHAPVSGTVEGIKDIQGDYYTVNPQAINEPGIVDVFCENRRSVMTVRRPSGAKVAIVAVGAMLVGSIKYMTGVDQVGAQIRRGQCLGAFYYGGSTVIVVYQKGDVSFDEDLVKNSTQENCETLMRVGWRMGKKL